MLNKNSSSAEKKEASDVIYDELLNYFFDNVTFINLAYSDLGGGGTTSTTAYGKLSRIIDTAKGRLMTPGKESRFRCQFYLRNPSVTDGYILSPAVYDSQTLPASLTTMSVFRSYVGLKFYKGLVYAAVKQAGEEEKLYPIDFTMTMFDATFTDTFSLEIIHNTNTTDIYINKTFYGSYTSNMVGGEYSNETFYPFFAPARSTSGAQVNIVSENLQFIQKR